MANPKTAKKKRLKQQGSSLNDILCFHCMIAKKGHSCGIKGLVKECNQYVPDPTYKRPNGGNKK